MGTAALFSKVLHEQLNAHAAWLPIANTFGLGDYGLVSDGVFTSIGNIAEFGVGYQAAQGQPAKMDFSSAGTRVVRLVADVEVAALPAEPVDAKLVIEFESERSFLVKAPKITVRQIQNLDQVARALAAAPGWEKKYRVVWATCTGHDCAVVTTLAANASFELAGKATALAQFELGAVEAGVTVAREENVGFKVLGKTGVLALRLFKLKLWGSGPKLLEGADAAGIDRSTEETLEDDV
jgi:hypothetical protein